MIESLDIPLIVLFSPTYYGKAELSSMKEEMRILGDVFKVYFSQLLTGLDFDNMVLLVIHLQGGIHFV